MSLAFSAFVPHPPIIVSGIGNTEDLKKVEKTRRSMSDLAGLFRQANIDVVVIVSPHSQLSAGAFLVNTADPLDGSFAQFGHPDINFHFSGATNEGNEIFSYLSSNQIAINTYYDNYLDHGILVPLSFLVTDRELQPIIPMSYSYLSIKQHAEFGRCLNDYFRSSEKRFALIASGDLSHRLTEDAPAGYSPRGKEFDSQIIDLIQQRNYSSIFSLETDFIEIAGECGYRSLCILLGAIKDNPSTPTILSYEGPFGVGYAVIHFPVI